MNFWKFDFLGWMEHEIDQGSMVAAQFLHPQVSLFTQGSTDLFQKYSTAPRVIAKIAALVDQSSAS